MNTKTKLIGVCLLILGFGITSGRAGELLFTKSATAMIVCVRKEDAFKAPYAPICDAEPLSTEWVALPMLSKPDPNIVPWGRPTIEIGLRSDGVVVWRNRPAPECK